MSPPRSQRPSSPLLLALAVVLAGLGCVRAARPPRDRAHADLPPPLAALASAQPPGTVGEGDAKDAPAGPAAATHGATVPTPAGDTPPPDADAAASPSSVPLPPPPGSPELARGKVRLDFRNGNPVLPVRLMEGRAEVRFSPRGRMRMRLEGDVEKVLEAPAGSAWTVRVTRGVPAVLDVHIQLAEFRFQDGRGLARAAEEWHGRGIATRTRTLGTVYGIAGKVIDNRRQLLLVEGTFTAEEASRRQAELLRDFGARTQVLEDLRTPPSGILEVLDGDGSVVALAEGTLHAETLDGAGFDVRQVEYGVGYDFHGFQDRSFRGDLTLTVDRGGELAVVNRVTLEDLLKGLVPSEIFARAHPEALKAQAVTARGEVLAKVGTRHLADPYPLCSEQHCAVYSGRTGEVPSTNTAVEETRGEAIFSKAGHLVDSVYSAVCGGHTENNDVVWGGLPDPNLRGRPDLLTPKKLPSPRRETGRFLSADLPAACRLSSFAQPTKYRWERRFSAQEVDALTQDLGIGAIQALTVGERGVSGRAKTLTLSGEKGATQVRGELNIRRRFRMLNSAMFEVSVERDTRGRPVAFLFRGGGWGHGVGLCQTGAIGRAEAGHDYRAILRHYFNGATVAPLY